MFAPRRYFLDITLAGMAGAPFAELKRLGIAAEERMLRATQGINTHRGAIFCLGLLCAAIGRCRAAGTPLTAMAGRLLVLCPGQGAQHPAMFDMARGGPAASLLLDACFTDPVLAPLLEGVVDGASLFANRVAQPAIVAATLAMWEALRETVPARHCRGCCRRATAASPAVPLPNSAPWTGYALD